MVPVPNILSNDVMGHTSHYDGEQPLGLCKPNMPVDGKIEPPGNLRVQGMSRS